MARARDPKAFAALAALCQSGSTGAYGRLAALGKIAFILAAKGGLVADVTVGDCVELLEIAARRAAGRRACREPAVLPTAARRGRLGDDAPATLRVFAGRGQPSCEQLIDRYRIACRPVRDVLVDYLAERQLSVDFSSLQHFAYLLGKLFWADLEAHHPGIDSLKLPREVAAAWKQRVMTRAKATAAEAAAAGPDRPARWPQRPERGAGLLPRPRRMGRGRPGPLGAACRALPGQRERRLAQEGPVLGASPAWTSAPENACRCCPPLSAWARPSGAAPCGCSPPPAAAAGEPFTAGGQTLLRPVMRTKTTGRIWAEDPASGRRRDLTFEEHRAFWTWAMVEVLRHTGMRIEELTELSHHSLIQYRLPGSGELVPLLQIAPSKTDPERLLVVVPELADVLATIVGRVRGAGPACRWSSPTTRTSGSTTRRCRCCSSAAAGSRTSRSRKRRCGKYLDHALAAIGVKDAGGRTLRYTFHDFRRMFITDAILHGMPPHIAQLVAGHRDINTTMGYKAVYPEEVISGHRAFINRRRALRPSEEYRVPTDEEWAEFLGHFARRKVALGDCGRSYATPCIHEHSCLRCPLLRPDPAERSRLVQIRDNLIDRIAEAESKPAGSAKPRACKSASPVPASKLAQMDLIADRRSATVNLGMPGFADAAGRTVTNPARLQPARHIS